MHISHPTYPTGEPVLVGHYVSYQRKGVLTIGQGQVTMVSGLGVFVDTCELVIGIDARFHRLSDHVTIPGFGMKREAYDELVRIVERLPFEASNADAALLHELARSIVGVMRERLATDRAKADAEAVDS